MAIQKQQEVSQVQIRINFQKNADMIAKLRSKASYREYGTEKSVVCTIIDGRNLLARSKQYGISDWTSELMNLTANLRLNEEQWDMLNSELHEVEGVGAEVVFDLETPIELSILDTKKDGTVISAAIYPAAMVEVEPVKVQRVGQVLDANDIKTLIAEAKERQERNRQEAISTRATKESADVANESVTANIM